MNDSLLWRSILNYCWSLLLLQSLPWINISVHKSKLLLHIIETKTADYCMTHCCEVVRSWTTVVVVFVMNKHYTKTSSWYLSESKTADYFMTHCCEVVLNYNCWRFLLLQSLTRTNIYNTKTSCCNLFPVNYALSKLINEAKYNTLTLEKIYSFADYRL